MSECRKRTATSSHKSRDKEQMPLNATSKPKLTETCHNDLKMQLRMARQSPQKLNSTYTHRKMAKELATAKPVKKEKEVKTGAKMLEILKMGLRKHPDDKGKSKSRRI
jgi:hypothetical protein